jgi:hypothetical protein
VVGLWRRIFFANKMRRSTCKSLHGVNAFSGNWELTCVQSGDGDCYCYAGIEYLACSEELLVLLEGESESGSWRNNLRRTGGF